MTATTLQDTYDRYFPDGRLTYTLADFEQAAQYLAMDLVKRDTAYVDFMPGDATVYQVLLVDLRDIDSMQTSTRAQAALGGPLLLTCPNLGGKPVALNPAWVDDSYLLQTGAVVNAHTAQVLALLLNCLAPHFGS